MMKSKDVEERVVNYLRRAGLDSLGANAVMVQAALDTADRLVEVAEGAGVPVDTTALYRYQVPKLHDDGTCSLELDDEPYDLRPILKAVDAGTALALARLNAMVVSLKADPGCGWLGIYQTRNKSQGRVLVKLAYRGKPSRAEFPLTKEFSAGSNNSLVGLSGQARVIDDVASHINEGGAFYVCDADVQAEACLPLFDEVGAVSGIVDAEDPLRGRFSGVKLAPFVALCVVAPAYLPR